MRNIYTHVKRKILIASKRVVRMYDARVGLYGEYIVEPMRGFQRVR